MFTYLLIYPLNPGVNKSCNLKCYSNKMQQIVANMIASSNSQLTVDFEEVKTAPTACKEKCFR